MVGQLEDIIFSGLHKKALEAGMNLNNPEDYTKFMGKVATVKSQAEKVITQMVEQFNCNCGNKQTQINPNTIPMERVIIDTSKTTGIVEAARIT
jgi:hypothetical protein